MELLIQILFFAIWPLCLVIIGLVLLQGGTGDVSSAFGGGGQLDTTLGVGASRKMAKLTGWLAVIFFLIVIVLALPHQKTSLAGFTTDAAKERAKAPPAATAPATPRAAPAATAVAPRIEPTSAPATAPRLEQELERALQLVPAATAPAAPAVVLAPATVSTAAEPTVSSAPASAAIPVAATAGAMP